MNAQQIRNWDEPYQEPRTQTMQVCEMRCRIEMAAQLAELNDNLRRILAVPHFKVDDEEVTGG